MHAVAAKAAELREILAVALHVPLVQAGDVRPAREVRLELRRGDVACVLTEPALTNCGLVPPRQVLIATYAAFGLAVLSKETAIFLTPAMLLLAWQQRWQQREGGDSGTGSPGKPPATGLRPQDRPGKRTHTGAAESVIKPGWRVVLTTGRSMKPSPEPLIRPARTR